MNPFRSLHDYELFVYALPQQFGRISSSTLLLVRRGRLYAELTGEIFFRHGYRLSLFERLNLESGEITITGYSYEAYLDGDKLYWYDSQPHPDDAALASTHPHHKHIPPDIKHHRVPAPGLSFAEPNLAKLIQEIEMLIDNDS